MKILVADDDRSFSRLMCKHLTAAGFEPIAALDGMQALMYSRKEAVSAIILDISMPGGNGLDALRILKTSSRNGHVPVVIVSANGNPETKARALALGAEAFFTKPVNVPQLIQFLKNVAINLAIGSAETPVSTNYAEQASKSVVRTVMVVDDDRVLVKMICRWLNEWGYATLAAYSVAEALKAMATRAVNLVIVDLEMPDVHGTALIQQMKAFNRTNAIRIIVLSGSVEANAGARLLSLGADDFLQKPPLMAAIQRAVAGQFTRSTSISSANNLVRTVEQPFLSA